MLILRAAFAVTVTALVVLLLAAGEIGGAIFAVALGVTARRSAESGRIAQLAGRLGPR